MYKTQIFRFYRFTSVLFGLPSCSYGGPSHLQPFTQVGRQWVGRAAIGKTAVELPAYESYQPTVRSLPNELDQIRGDSADANR